MFDSKICVSGAAAGFAYEVGFQLGVQGEYEIAARGGILVASVVGLTISFSPAINQLKYACKYCLPVAYHDPMFFTRHDYVGCDSIFIGIFGDMSILVDRAKRGRGWVIMDEGPIALVSSVYTAINASEYV